MSRSFPPVYCSYNINAHLNAQVSKHVVLNPKGSFWKVSNEKSICEELLICWFVFTNVLIIMISPRSLLKLPQEPYILGK